MKANEIVPGCNYFHEKLGVVAVYFKATTSNLIKCFIQKPLSAANYCGECIWVYPASLMKINVLPKKEKLCATVSVETKSLEKAIQQLITELMMVRMSIDLNTEAVNRSKDIFEVSMGVKSIHFGGVTLTSRDQGAKIIPLEKRSAVTKAYVDKVTAGAFRFPNHPIMPMPDIKRFMSEMLTRCDFPLIPVLKSKPVVFVDMRDTS